MQKIKFFFSWARSFFPTDLPKGATSLQDYIGHVIYLSGPAIPDNRSTRFAVATMIMHLGVDSKGYAKDSVPVRYFVKKIRKAAANECAFQFLDSLKKQKDAAAAPIQEQPATAKPELTVVT